MAGVACTARPTPPTSTTAWSSPIWTRTITASPPRHRMLRVDKRHGVRRPRAVVRGAPSRAAAASRGPVRRASSADRASRLRHPVQHRRSPAVADGERERVGGVGRSGCLAQPEQPGDHGGHLLLAGPALTGDGRLHLAGRVEGDRQPGPRREQRDHAAGLRGAHDGAHVVLAEHPLDGDDVRPVPVDPALDHGAEREQPVRERRVGRGAHDVDGDVPDLAPPPPPSTTPSPHRVNPGSTPSTRTRVSSSARTAVRRGGYRAPGRSPQARRGSAGGGAFGQAEQALLARQSSVAITPVPSAPFATRRR